MNVEFKIPVIGEKDLSVNISSGEALFILGKNGVGKSALLIRLAQQYQQFVVRISATRRTWLNTSKAELSHTQSDIYSSQIKTNTLNQTARFYDTTYEFKSNWVIDKFIKYDEHYHVQIGRFAKKEEYDKFENLRKMPSPLENINKVFLDANLKLSFDINNLVIRVKKNHNEFDLQQASDGERSAFILSSEVITAEENSIFVIDEPEQHLHKSIVAPLINSLIKNRSDCIFIIATHDIETTTFNENSKIITVDSCHYEYNEPKFWILNILNSTKDIPNALKSDIIGEKKKIIFVEGDEKNSIDKKIYESLFPEFSIVPKGSCSNVVKTVKAIRENEKLFWLDVVGIIDSDFRTPSEIDDLKRHGVHCLPYSSIESLLYHFVIIEHLAKEQADMYGLNSNLLIAKSIEKAIHEFNEAKDNIIERNVKHYIRKLLQNEFETKVNNIREKNNSYTMKLKIDIGDFKTECEEEYVRAVKKNDFDFFLKRYSLKSGNIRNSIANALEFERRDKYETAALNAIKRYDDLRREIMQLLVNDNFLESPTEIFP